MYQTLIFYHSIVRWLVLIGLIYCIVRAWTGFRKREIFNKTDNAVRHWTATVAHIQLVIGVLLYTKSPPVHYFWARPAAVVADLDFSFFPLVHMLLMLTGIVVVTIGSSLAKRRPDDRGKFRTMMTWYSVALMIIFIAIPWPFSPLAARPYFR